VIAKPVSAAPNVPPGFQVELFASNLRDPRTVRVAPNGDIFIAESEPGRIRVLRAADGAAKPSSNDVFASGLDQPFGIAFYPSGSDPQWMYVANTGSVVRHPYRSGDLKARGKAEVIVRDLPRAGGRSVQRGHITRDIAFSKDGRQMFVSVGSASNDGEDDCHEISPFRSRLTKDLGVMGCHAPRLAANDCRRALNAADSAAIPGHGAGNIRQFHARPFA
jgi:glucose/arabinose dehydrogenase